MREKKNPQFPPSSGQSYGYDGDGNRFCRGAKMGRHHALLDFEEPRNIRLFKMALDSGGYDDGGAYWGIGEPIYIAEDKDGDRTYVRAFTRAKAAFLLGVANPALKNPIAFRDWYDYGFALLDGRAPMPAGKDRDDVIAWLQSNGVKMGWSWRHATQQRMRSREAGWRPFRVRLADEPLLPKEFPCPASEEAGRKLQCVQCRSCGGANGQTGSPAIIAHGNSAIYFRGNK